MEHSCNLQCQCHVPVHATINPPCYLCVLDTCSLSTNQHDTVPSAPPLNPVDVVQAPTPQTVPDTAYGWQPTLVRTATMDLNDTNSQNTDDQWRNPNVLVALPPEDDDERATGRNSAAPHDAMLSDSQHSTSPPNVSQIMEGCRPVFATEYRRGRTSDNANAQPPYEEVQRIHPHERHIDEDTYETLEVHATPIYVDDEDEGGHIDKIIHESRRDLADSIKNLLLRDKDSRVDDFNPNQQSSTHRSGNQEVVMPEGTNWLLSNVYREKKRKRFSDVGSRPLAFPMDRNMYFPQSKSLSDLPEHELQYQRINRIHRRETSAAACQRYNDEHFQPRRSHVNLRHIVALPWDDQASVAGATARDIDDLEAREEAEKNIKYGERWQSLDRKLSRAELKKK